MRFLMNFLLALCVSAQLVAQEATQRVDGYGDPLPAGAVARLGSTRFRLPKPIVMMAALSDRGEIAVACAQDLVLQIVDVGTGKVRELGELKNFPQSDLQRRYSGMAYSVKHKSLCVLRGGGVDAVDVETGKITWSYEITTSFFGLTPNGEYLLLMERNRVLKLVKVADGSLKAERDLTRVSQVPLALHPTRPIVTISSNEGNKTALLALELRHRQRRNR
ncbi:MAG: hypothetical protein QM811_20150 [Pirellulales bacterium]